VPIKKSRARQKGRATPKASGASDSFGHFVRKLPGTDPLIAAFQVHAAENKCPDTGSWAKIRSHLSRTGAKHEAMVGARIAWREFQSH
jgi:hypothetical protein